MRIFFPNTRGTQPIVLILLGAILGVALLVAGYLVYTSATPGGSRGPLQTQPEGNTPSTPEEPTNDVSKQPTSFGRYTGQESSDMRRFTQTRFDRIEIAYEKGAIPVSREEQRVLLASKQAALRVNPNEYRDCTQVEVAGVCDVYLFHAGEITAPEDVAGTPVYWVIRPVEGMGVWMNTELGYYDQEAGEWLALRESTVPENDFFFAGFLQYEGRPKAPERIDAVYEDGSWLKKHAMYQPLGGPFDQFGSEGNAGGIIDVRNGSVARQADVFAGIEPVATDATYGPIYLREGVYYIVLEDGAIFTYDLMPYFFVPENEGEDKDMYVRGYRAQADWNADAVIASDERFLPAGDIGRVVCGDGFIPFTNLENREAWFDEQALVQVGTASRGDGIFELRNKTNNTYYRQVFEFGYEGSVYWSTYDLPKEELQERTAENERLSEEEKYARFVTNMPLIFWKDPEGQYRSFRKMQYDTLAECAKPVVYVYPEYAQDVRVEVKPNGGFTVTEPVPGPDGWRVHAKPTGELFSYDDGNTYPYLFWESKSYGDTGVPEQGFVLSRSEVPSEMRALLKHAGLVTHEIEDFMEYWEPKLMHSPYVFVTFVPQHVFNLAAPLTVEPAPDYMLRVFMYFEHLEEPVTVEPLKLNVPPRHGFSVIEWGGAKQERYDD